MTLAALIRKRGTAPPANANPAKAANAEGVKGPTLAKLAALALAKPTEGQTAIISTVHGADLPEPQNDTRHFRWLIHFPDRDPVEHTFLPELAHAEVMAWHRDAIAVEPMPERTRHKTTPEQETELRALVASVGAAYALHP